MQASFREALARLERDHWWYRARRTILETAIDRLVGSSGRSLTVGVGVAREAEMLSRRSRLVAIDRAPIDPECAQFAHAAQAEAAALPFRDQVFDAVFIFDVLEHIERHEAAVRELRRVMRDGARLLITVPAFMFLFGRQDVVSEHKRRYRRDELRRLLDRHGFAVDYATYFNTLLFPPIAVMRLVGRWRRSESHDQGRGIGDFSVRLPAPLERVLEALFAAERHAVARLSLPFGVSLLCLARRLPAVPDPPRD